MIRATLILAVFAFSTILACGGDDDDDSGAGDDGDTAPDDDDGDDDTDGFTPGSGCLLPGEGPQDGFRFIGNGLRPSTTILEEDDMICCTEWSWSHSEANGCSMLIHDNSCFQIDLEAECSACEIHQVPSVIDDEYCP
ncbi:MAG: hypothetical protein M5R36_10945 [Deltaproteobacteria bacterium]|nr:hypothetical protein [Deltaproteobacteria bacterium]